MQGSITRDMVERLGVNPNAEMIRLAHADHDPFDAYRRQPHAFRLVPLIYSAGTDQQYGVLIIEDAVTWIAPVLSGQAIQSFMPNPYRAIGNELLGMVASQNPEAAVDNLHNHLVEGQ